jgi:transcriptional regulator with XRE-family HTH domain
MVHPSRAEEELSSRSWSAVTDSLEELGPMVVQRRGELGLSLRDASAVSGVPVATLSRIEQGRMPDLATFRRVVEWLGVPPERFFTTTERAESTPEAIAEHLMADPALTPAAADKIAGIVRDLYESLASTDRRLAVHLRAAKTFSLPALRLLTDLLDEMQAAVEGESPVI